MDVLQTANLPAKEGAQRALLSLIKLSTAEHTDHTETIECLLRQVSEYFDLPVAMINRLEGARCSVTQFVGTGNSAVPKDALPFKGAPCEQAMKQTTPYWATFSEPLSIGSGRKPLTVASYLGMRLFVGGRVWGTLALTAPDVRDTDYDTADLCILETAAVLIGHHLSLSSADERYDLAVNGANVGIWDWDVQNDRHYWSPRYLSLLGIADPNFVPDREAFESRVHPDDLSEIHRKYSEPSPPDEPLRLEYRMRHEDGRWIHVRARGQGIWKDDQLVRIAGSVEDVTADKEGEAALRCSEERYDFAIRGAGVGIWDWNVITGDRFWSKDMLDLLKITDPDFEPTLDDFFDRLHPDDREHVISLRQDHIEHGRDYDVECRVRTEEDSYVWVRFRGQAFRNADGDLIRMAGSCYSIEDRKKAEQRESERTRMLGLAGRAAKVGYFEIDLESDKTTLSDEVFAMYELDRGSHKPSIKDMVELTHPDDRRLVRDALDDAIRTGQPQSTARRVIRVKSGEERFVQSWIECYYNRDGEPARIFGVTQDVTEQRAAEVRLRKQAVELQRTNKELERFAYVASHDLQEPLRKVSAFGGMLNKRYADKLDDDGQRMVGIMVDGATRMQLLIEDLLRYSKSSNVEMMLEDVDLNDLFDDVRESISVSIDENEASLDVGELPVVHADAALLRQLFQNLVSNALKYRGEAIPKVAVTASSNDQEWRIRVDDNGIGFSDEDAKQIFDMFRRLHGRGEYPGTGIGLALCHRIVERHRGRIWAEGRPGKGASFYVALPKEAED